jgi:single-strand DNA-binding protein
MGNITRDIELKYTQNNQAVATVGLAVNRKYKGADGQLKEDVTFVDCDAWGKTAEMISQYFAKGRPIFIEGRLRLDTWKDKQDGSNRSKLKVVIENFQFVDSKPGGGAGGNGTPGGTRPVPQGRPAGAPAAAGEAPPYEPIEEDDIPF